MLVCSYVFIYVGDYECKYSILLFIIYNKGQAFERFVQVYDLRHISLFYMHIRELFSKPFHHTLWKFYLHLISSTKNVYVNMEPS